MNKNNQKLLCSSFLASLFILSCMTSPVLDVEYEDIKMEKLTSRLICSSGVMNAKELHRFFMMENPGADSHKVFRLAEYYIREGRDEGVNSDIAFVQMCLETGFLRFGGLVTVDMNNFCGLGAMSKEEPGVYFPSEEIGVRAHIQHLQAYGCTRELRNDLVDPRYKWVLPRGKSPSIYGLAGTWARDPLYGEKLNALLERLEKFVN